MYDCLVQFSCVAYAWTVGWFCGVPPSFVLCTLPCSEVNFADVTSTMHHNAYSTSMHTVHQFGCGGGGRAVSCPLGLVLAASLAEASPCPSWGLLTFWCCSVPVSLGSIIIWIDWLIALGHAGGISVSCPLANPKHLILWHNWTILDNDTKYFCHCPIMGLSLNSQYPIIGQYKTHSWQL